MVMLSSSPLSSYFLYVKKFITHPRSMGTIMPSSRWLCDAMLSPVDWNENLNIAEIGAGDGVLTKRILSRMGEHSSIDAYEIDESFVNILNRLEDERISIKHTSAENLAKDYDVILSGIPFRSLSKRSGLKILKQASQSLVAESGRFILFQYTTGCEIMLSRYFTFTKFKIYRNMPPAWIYVCQPKKNTEIEEVQEVEEATTC